MAGLRELQNERYFVARVQLFGLSGRNLRVGLDKQSDKNGSEKSFMDVNKVAFNPEKDEHRNGNRSTVESHTYQQQLIWRRERILKVRTFFKHHVLIFETV